MQYRNIELCNIVFYSIDEVRLYNLWVVKIIKGEYKAFDIIIFAEKFSEVENVKIYGKRHGNIIAGLLEVLVL